MQQNGSYIDQVNPNLQEQAEELMNSLFSEVEQTLSIDSDSSGDNSSGDLVKHSHNNFKQSDQLESQAPKSNSVNTSAISLAITKVERDSTATQITKTQITKQAKSDRKVNLPKTKPPLEPPLKIESPPKPESIGFIDSLLLGSAFTSAIFAVVLGLINSKITPLNPQSQLPIQLPVDNSALDSSAVAEKLRRSLLEIPEPPTENVSVAKLAPNSSAVIDIPQPAVKPIYIPIYQPPSTPTNTINPIVTAPAPVASVSSKKPAAKGSYTLIGVLDLGDRSSAMFDINGSIQSIKLGSVVGDSGWKVSRIAQQEVILKKGNEDNTVTVGQKF
jgi:hypothetical protein